MDTARTGTRLARGYAFSKTSALLLIIRRFVPMTRSPLFVAVSAVLFFTSGTWGDVPKEEKELKAVTVPLDQIWATEMPGTRDIEKLDPKRPLVYEIRRAIGFPPRDKKAKPAFAVQNEGLDVLREAHDVLVHKKKPRDKFSTRSELSVVFFTYETGPYVHIHQVERQGNKITINYQFVPHENEETTRYIALIPLGKLEAGKYRVYFNQTPMEQKYLDLGFREVSETNANRIVCGPFSFTVSDKGD